MVDRRVVAAWAVHAFTLTGIVWAVLALLAVIDNQPKLMWLWLGIALVVDGVDGALARKAEVKVHAPHFDGVILDSIVDYLTWTLIPAIFLYRNGLLGSGWSGIALLVLIAVSSMFCYANTRMKTADHYFLGFPAAWNVVALALWLLAAPVPVNAVIVVVLAALTWAPIAFVHPLRVSRFRAANLVAAVVWIATSAVLVIVHPVTMPWLVVAWLITGLWLVLSGVIRTIVATRQHHSTRA